MRLITKRIIESILSIAQYKSLSNQSVRFLCLTMEFRVIHGKKVESKVYHVLEENQLYLKKCEKSDRLIYLKCYFKSCVVSGKIEKEKFYHIKHGIHIHHDNSVNNLMIEWDFYDF